MIYKRADRFCGEFLRKENYFSEDNMNCACFIDLGAAKLNYEGFRLLIEQAGAKCEQVKFYGYNAKKNGDFNAYIRESGAEVALPLHNRKKVRVDIRQVVDSVVCACSNRNIEAILLVCAEVDCLPMISAIKAQGKKVYIGVESVSSVAERCDGYFILQKTFAPKQEQREAATDKEEFLPYTGIERDDSTQMDEVREKLTKVLQQKATQQKTKPPKGDEELVRLLQKYF